MKIVMTICGAIIFASFIVTSCGGDKNETPKKNVDTTKTVTKPEKPKSDSKEVIKAISEKYYIPVNEAKSNLIFTVNQNLNFQLLNYKGNFEGKFIDGKVQFDDKNSTMIDFILKGENLILKNQNDVEVEFRVATENEILAGIWYYSLGGTPLRLIIDNKGNWSVPDDPMGTRKGQSKSLGNKKFIIYKYSVGNDANFKLTTMNNGVIYWSDSDATYNHTRSQNGKLESLNKIFN